MGVYLVRRERNDGDGKSMAVQRLARHGLSIPRADNNGPHVDEARSVKAALLLSGQFHGAPPEIFFR